MKSFFMYQTVGHEGTPAVKTVMVSLNHPKLNICTKLRNISLNYANGELSPHQLETVATPLHTVQ
jgi:hypothetical protein